jgi:hypothetical protein
MAEHTNPPQFASTFRNAQGNECLGEEFVVFVIGSDNSFLSAGALGIGA